MNGLVAWGFIASIALFCAQWLLGMPFLGLLAVICIMPLSIAILGALIHQITGFISEIRR